MGCLILFFGIFAAAGAAAFYFVTFLPLWGVTRAQSWTETPCTIVTSEVKVHDGDDGDTYSIDIQYEYTVDGLPYRGEKYHFMPGASSGRKGKQAVVDRYPVGLATSCYVNPSDPREAVINRGLTMDMWWGLFPLPFLAVGIGGLLFGTGLIGKKQKQNAGFDDEPRALSASKVVASIDDWDDEYEAEQQPDGPVVLKPKHSPLAKFIGIVCIALFWNGITSVFVYKVVESHLEGKPEWCLTFFITPFVLVGLLLIWGIFHSFLSLFIPRPTLTIDRARIPLGGSARLAWKFSGSAHVIRQLKITLRGQESATYRRGTDTHTDKQKFHEEVVYETHDPLEIPEGEIEVRIPDGTMHSFRSDNNAVEWELHLAGEIALRPDVDTEFPLTITPHEHSQHRNS